MDKKTKELIRKVLDYSSQISNRVWRDILWLTNDRKLGIRRNRIFFWEDRYGQHDASWKMFFRKCKTKWNERQIRDNLHDYLLLINPEITARDILKCRNVEIRSILLQNYGIERLFQELGGKVIHHDGSSQLYEIKLGEGIEPIRIIRVKDSTTSQYYILRVPPSVTMCKEAIAWTFGMVKEEYKPVKET
jgi:hypothetical protein